MYTLIDTKRRMNEDPGTQDLTYTFLHTQRETNENPGTVPKPLCTCVPIRCTLFCAGRRDQPN